MNFKAKTDINPQKVEEFLTKGVENIFPNKDYLVSRMLSGNKLTIYLGIDPTGPTLHMGHAIQLKKLGEFQKLGHQVILLIGDFTAMIGDPTDKKAIRKQLTRKEVLNNCKLYKKQASIFLKFSGSNKALLKYNSKWLAKMNLTQFIDLASKITVDQMLKRDMFAKRMEESKPIALHEFFYPLMQGYDSVAMNVDGEIGGNDQMFNMLTGRDLLKEVSGKEKFVITSKLLVDNTGKKMGKTEGNIVSFLDGPFEKFGKIMSWTDGMIVGGYELCTDTSLSEIKEIEESLSGGKVNPRDLKVRLAKEVVKFYHGAEMAEKAEQNFVDTFKKGGVPDDAPEKLVEKGIALVTGLMEAGLVPSKSEFRRLVEEGAISEVETEEKISDLAYKIEKDINIKVGKRRFLRIKIK